MSLEGLLAISSCLHEYSGYPTDFIEAEILGVGEAVKNITEAGATDPVVKATVMLSESGFASLRDAFVTGEFKDDSLTGKLCYVLFSNICVMRQRRQTEGSLWQRFIVFLC